MELTFGSTVSVEISDPFELSQTIECQVAGLHSFESGVDIETILLRTPASLARAGRTYRYLALRGRGVPGIIDELQLGQRLECNGIGIDADAAAGTPLGDSTPGVAV